MKRLNNQPGRGVLFKETRKASDKAPDFRGGVNLDGIEYELACWERTAKSGMKYWSLSVSIPRESTSPGRPAGEDEIDAALGPADNDAALRREVDQRTSDAMRSRSRGR